MTDRQSLSVSRRSFVKASAALAALAAGYRGSGAFAQGRDPQYPELEHALGERADRLGR